jgi:hypothetical protein
MNRPQFFDESSFLSSWRHIRPHCTVARQGDQIGRFFVNFGQILKLVEVAQILLASFLYVKSYICISFVKNLGWTKFWAIFRKHIWGQFITEG